MEFNKFVEWAFQALVVGGLAMLIGSLKGINTAVNSIDKKLDLHIQKTQFLHAELDRDISHLKRAVGRRA